MVVACRLATGLLGDGTSGRSVGPVTIFPISPEVPSPAQSVMTTTLTRTLTVAAGVFAPGHLGELTRYLPFELVDDVLAQTRTMQQRLLALPSRTGVYFVLALGLFPGIGCARVWAKLCAGLAGAGMVVPAVSEKALRELRRRLGAAPFKALFELVAGPVGLEYRILCLTCRFVVSGSVMRRGDTRW
jgi:transposase IS4-like protein